MNSNHLAAHLQPSTSGKQGPAWSPPAISLQRTWHPASPCCHSFLSVSTRQPKLPPRARTHTTLTQSSDETAPPSPHRAAGLSKVSFQPFHSSYPRAQRNAAAHGTSHCVRALQKRTRTQLLHTRDTKNDCCPARCPNHPPDQPAHLHEDMQAYSELHN